MESDDARFDATTSAKSASLVESGSLVGSVPESDGLFSVAGIAERGSRLTNDRPSPYHSPVDPGRAGA
jgi:hypothetical protein